MPSTLDRATEQLAGSLRLLDNHLAEGPGRLLRLLGWELPPGVSDIGLAGLDLSALIDKVHVLGTVKVSGTDIEITAAYADLAVGVADALAQLRRVANGFTATPDYLARTHIVAEFFPRLLDFVVMQAVAALAPPAFAVGQLAGIFVAEPHPADPVNFQTEHVRHIIHWDRLGTLLSDPASLFRQVYGWGSPNFDAAALVVNIGNLLQYASVSTQLRQLPARAEAQLSGQPVPAGAHPSLQLLLSLVKGLGLDTLDVGVSLFGLNPTAAGGADGGLGFAPYAHGTADVSFPLADRVALTVDASVDLEGGVALVLRPDRPVDVKTNLTALTGPAGVPTGSVALALRLDARPDAPVVLLNFPGVGRVDIKSVSVGGGVRSGHPAVTFALEGGHILLDASGGDGFLSSVLGSARVDTTFDLHASYSPGTGLQLGGSGGLELQIPVHVELGPVEVQKLYVAIGLAGGAVQLELSAGFTASLGPINAAVDRMGLHGDLSFPAGGGNIGPAQLGVGFKPPNGMGLALDTSVLTGGGYLFADPDRGEYAGALELEFADVLALKAIGLITTRMPDGSSGFSLLLVLTAEFPGGLQLGYGFKLLAVGGIVGLNRGMRLDAIMEGVRTGAIESVMFPQDVVANAPRILSDLRAFFPPQDGIFLIGPMAKLGWGTPTLVTVSLGVIIEIPGNIAILGVLRVALPTEDEAILLLQVNFAGAIEFDKKRIYFFAALYQSRILTITIEGELGLLVAYGEQPDFVLTVGGFHPAFKPPPLPFPVPRRVSINILNSDNAHIGVDGYFAVTSNTAQFGAHAELFFRFSAFTVEGHIGFDALLQFSPFRFVIGISAGVSVKVFGIGLFGISLDFTLSGPTPWEAKGSGSISLLFFSISVDFDVTWGEDRDTTLPPVDVLPLLAAELTKPESWRTRAPAGGAPLVNLRALAPAEADVVLHPLGTLFVQQRVVPLDIRVDKVGSERADDVSRCQVSVDGTGLTKVSDAVDMFALAQFQNLSDAEKLSLPSFEREHAGLELAPDGAALASSRAVRRSARYEEIVIDSVGRQASRFTAFNSTLFQHFLGGASVTRSPLAQAERTLRQPFRDRITVPGDSYVVASARDNTATGPVFGSQAQARAHLDDLLAADPNQVDSLHVIPAMEAAP